MDIALKEIIYNRYNYIRAETYESIHHLLEEYGYSEIDEKVANLIGTDYVDDYDSFDAIYNQYISESIYELLESMFIFPVEGLGINELYSLLDGLYKIEHHLDSAAIIAIIEECKEIEISPTETLVKLLSDNDYMEWTTATESLRDVSRIAINEILVLHKNIVESNADSGDESPIMLRIDGIRAFFEKYPNTITYSYINNQYISIPTTAEQALTFISKPIYNLDNPELIAIECVAIAHITPVTEASIGQQAKVILNKLYTDVNIVSKVVQHIEKIMSELKRGVIK